jgi:hypothetical protein
LQLVLPFQGARASGICFLFHTGECAIAGKIKEPDPSWRENSTLFQSDFLIVVTIDKYYICRGVQKEIMADRIGDFLVKIGAMTPEQVQAVLRLQEMGNRQRFGDIALALGYLSDNSLKRYTDYLEKQEKA